MPTSRKKKVAKKGLLRKKLVPSPLIPESERAPLDVLTSRQQGFFTRTVSLLRILKFLWFLLRLSSNRQKTPEQRAIEVRHYLETQGGIWIKTGQLLAFRRDLLPRVYCEELSKLQDRASAFPAEVAHAVLEQALQGPVPRFFTSFDKEPIAAATIGQVHRAVLRNEGVSVAVKIKRPDIDATFKRDMTMMRSLVSWLTRFNISPQVRWNDMIEELDTMLNEELDYRLEAAAGARLRKNVLAHGVYIPKVFTRYCTKETIVTEFIDGVPMSDYLRVHQEDPRKTMYWCHQNRINPRRVAFRLYETLQRQIYEENLFHADLHPGNIMLLKNSRVALIDFGAVGSLDAKFREQLAQFNTWIAQGSYLKAMQLLLNMSAPLPPIDVDELSRQMARYQRDAELRTSAKTIPYSEKMSLAALTKINKLLRDYMIPSSWDLLKFQRTFFALESSIMYLNPKANLGKFNVRYWRRAARRKEVEQREAPMFQGVRNLIQGLGDLKERLRENLMFISDVVRRAARVVEPRYLVTLRVVFTYIVGALKVAIILAAAIFVERVRDEVRAPGYQPEELPSVIAKSYALISAIPYHDYIVWAAIFWILFTTLRRVAIIRRVYSK